jgi:hypothetical protein
MEGEEKISVRMLPHKNQLDNIAAPIKEMPHVPSAGTWGTAVNKAAALHDAAILVD